MRKNLIVLTWIVISLMFPFYAAKAESMEFGQTIQITTRLHSFVGRPTWLLEIRDVDNNQTIPYLFDITRGGNFWIALTYGRNYLVTASRLKMSSYQSRYNIYDVHEVNDFCHLESNGRINKGESLYVTLQGDLSPNPDMYTCHVMKYGNAEFTVAPKTE
ncbi:MAG: hypothetical protein WAW86_07890 [Gammaproteobacteria bacterium]